MTRREAAHSGTRCYTNDRARIDASILLPSDGTGRLCSPEGDRLISVNSAGVLGLEPRMAEPESAVLPITPYPKGLAGAGAGDRVYLPRERTRKSAPYRAFAAELGLLFQIVDDILDVEESSEALGKTAGKDAAQHKITFPAVYGLEASRRMAEEECARAHDVLSPFADRAARLHELADLIVHRKS